MPHFGRRCLFGSFGVARNQGRAYKQPDRKEAIEKLGSLAGEKIAGPARAGGAASTAALAKGAAQALGVDAKNALSLWYRAWEVIWLRVMA